MDEYRFKKIINMLEVRYRTRFSIKEQLILKELINMIKIETYDNIIENDKTSRDLHSCVQLRFLRNYIKDQKKESQEIIKNQRYHYNFKKLKEL